MDFEIRGGLAKFPKQDARNVFAPHFLPKSCWQKHGGQKNGEQFRLRLRHVGFDVQIAKLFEIDFRRCAGHQVGEIGRAHV